MVKRIDNKSAYTLSGEKGKYIIVIERLKNTNAGAPRYEATVINTHNTGSAPYLFTKCFRFTGSYRGEKAEALKAIELYEMEV